MRFLKSVVSISLVLVVFAVCWAQDDEIPLDPQFQGDSQPSAPDPTPVAPSPGSTPIAAPVFTPVEEDSTVETFGPSSRRGRLEMYDEEPEQTTETGSAEVPKEYIIVRGDTLWDICSKFFGDPFYWPKLWSLNHYIKNPHLIFPGDRLRFFPGSQTSLPRLQIGEDAEVFEQASQRSTDPETIRELPVIQQQDGVRLKPLTTAWEKNHSYAGKITHSLDAKIELSYGDEVFFKVARRNQAKVGDRFHVIERLERLRGVAKSPKKNMGWMVRKNAIVEVTKVFPKVLQGKIVESHYAVRRGDKLIPVSSEVFVLKPHTVQSYVGGHIIGSESSNLLLGNNDYIYLDIGKKHLAPGTKLVVTKQDDPILGPSESRHPDYLKGRLLVVEVFEHCSLAYVVDSIEALEVGDWVREQID